MYKRHYILVVGLIIAPVILFFASVVIADSGSKIICDFCKRQISGGKYIEAESKYYHPEHFFCSNCQRPLADRPYIDHKGKRFCERCFREIYSRECTYCGESISGKYVEFKGKPYHKSCYNNHIALKCSLCGGIIEGQYIYDYWGNKYHRFHQNSDAQCRYCGRFISEGLTAGGAQYPDGRHVCGICRRDAIDDKIEAESILSGVMSKLGRLGIDIEPDDINLYLVDSRKLNRLTRDTLGNHAGLTSFEGKAISGKLVYSRFDIYILYGLPGTAFTATVAHELMHVWQYQHASMEIDPALSEGSCNFASYLMLKDENDPLAEYLIENMDLNPDKFYGEGYRRVRKFARRKGVEYWLNHLKSSKNFPPGY